MQKHEIRIRRAEPDDFRALYEIYSAPSAFGGTLQMPYPSQELWRRRLAEPEDGVYHLVATVTDRVVGMLTLGTTPARPRRRHVGSVGMGVHDEWQRQGIGSALLHAGVDMADNWLDLTRLELEVYVDNEPAIRLYERFGFEREGVLRQYAYRNGRLADALFMARLRVRDPS